MKTKPASPQTSGIVVKELNWGCIFYGTKAALIAAGLAKAEHLTDKALRTAERLSVTGFIYELPFNWQRGEGRNPAPRWDVSRVSKEKAGVYAIYVRYSVLHDLNIRERVYDAIISLRVLLRMVEQIAPRYIADQLGIKVAAREE